MTSHNLGRANPRRVLETQQLLRAYGNAKHALPAREYQILALRASAHTITDTASELGLTPNRAKQIEEHATARILHSLKDTPQGFWLHERYGPQR